ncbi:MAG: hypothetical protein BZ138_07235, partial [Methanosphaera sp. rholeuAM270]
LNVTAENITYGEEETITVTLPGDAQGLVTVNVTGRDSMTINLADNNTIIIPAYDLVVGEYEVNISYYDDNYALKTNSTTFRVDKAVSNVEVEGISVRADVNEIVTVNVTDRNASGKVNITLYKDGVLVGEVVTIDSLTNESGVTHDFGLLEVGEYTVNVTYYGDSNYNDSNASYTFTVSKIPTFTNVTVLNSTAGNVTLNITVKGDDGNVIREGKVNVTVAGNVVGVDLSGEDFTVVNLRDNITASGDISVSVLYTG